MIGSINPTSNTEEVSNCQESLIEEQENTKQKEEHSKTSQPHS